MTQELGWKQYSFPDFSKDIEKWNTGKSDKTLYDIFTSAVHEGMAQVEP